MKSIERKGEDRDREAELKMKEEEGGGRRKRMNIEERKDKEEEEEGEELFCTLIKNNFLALWYCRISTGSQKKFLQGCRKPSESPRRIKTP